MHCFRHSL